MAAKAAEVNAMTASIAPSDYEPRTASFRVFSAVYTGACALAVAGALYLLIVSWMPS